MAAQRLECELVTDAVLEKMVAHEMGDVNKIPDRAWRPVTASILASLGLEHANVVVCCVGAEMLWNDLPGVLRFHVVAPESIRLNNIAVDCRIPRAAAKVRLRRLVAEKSQIRKRRLGDKASPVTAFDVVKYLYNIDRVLNEI